MKKLILTIIIITVIGMSYNMNICAQQVRSAQTDKLILTGLVVFPDDFSPVEDVLVKLAERGGISIQEYETRQDGIFYFQLEQDKIYEVFSFNQEGAIAGKKIINTIGKTKTDILNCVFEYHNKDRFEDDGVAYAPIDPIVRGAPSISVHTALKNPNKQTELTFKVQVGAFNKPLPFNSTYFDDLRGMMSTERANANLVRYVVGNFSIYQTAEDYKKRLVEMGYENAFIAPYMDGFRLEIPIEKALKLYDFE